MLRYLREPALVFWGIFVVLAAAVALLAFTHSPGHAPNFDGSRTVIPSQSTTVFALESQIAKLPDEAPSPQALAAWSSETSAMADTDARTYVEEGALASSPLLAAYRSLASDAAALPGSGDLTSAERAVMLDGDDLEVGMPTFAPSLPGGA